MNQLGPHGINMDPLMGNDLERMAQVIAEAMHEERPDIGKMLGPDPAGGNEGGGEQDQDRKPNRVPDPVQKTSERLKQKGARLRRGAARQRVNQSIFLNAASESKLC